MPALPFSGLFTALLEVGQVQRANAVLPFLLGKEALQSPVPFIDAFFASVDGGQAKVSRAIWIECMPSLPSPTRSREPRWVP